MTSFNWTQRTCSGWTRKAVGILSMHKVFMFWQAAAMGASKFTHAAKVDDDSYLHVPNYWQN